MFGCAEGIDVNAEHEGAGLCGRAGEDAGGIVDRKPGRDRETTGRREGTDIPGKLKRVLFWLQKAKRVTGRVSEPGECAGRDFYGTYHFLPAPGHDLVERGGDVVYLNVEEHVVARFVAKRDEMAGDAASRPGSAG